MITRVPHGENAVFLVRDQYVIKVYNGARRQQAREVAALTNVRISIETPRVVHSGESFVVMTQLHGRRLIEIWRELPRANKLAIAAQLGRVFREMHVPAEGAWPAFLDEQRRTCIARQSGVPDAWLREMPRFFDVVPHRPPVFLHGDVHGGNLLAQERDGEWVLTGLFDFGDSLAGDPEYDFVAPGVLMMPGDGELQRAMLGAYGYTQFDDALRTRLMALTVLYECSDLRKYALRLGPHALELSLEELERAIWAF